MLRARCLRAFKSHWEASPVAPLLPRRPPRKMQVGAPMGAGAVLPFNRKDLIGTVKGGPKAGDNIIVVFLRQVWSGQSGHEAITLLLAVYDFFLIMTHDLEVQDGFMPRLKLRHEKVQDGGYRA